MSALFVTLSALGGLVGLTGIGAIVLLWPQIRKLSAETKQTAVTTALAEDAADLAEAVAIDAHWQAIITTQTDAVVRPLTDRIDKQDVKIDEQDKKIAELERKIDTIARSYRAALGYIRILLSRMRHHDITPDPAPALIADDI